MSDIVALAFIAIVTPLLLIAAISFVLHFFVALNATPSRRAAWTAGIAYVAATALILLAAPAGCEIYAPLAPLPGGLVVFWFWRADFRRGWVQNPDALPEGVTLANDDWRIGILHFLALATLAVGIGLVRMIARGS